MRLLVAHPSPDVYGSDLQLVETVRGLHQAGQRVTVVVPEHGPLIPLLEAAGASVEVMTFPVLRKAYLSPTGLVRLAAALMVFWVRAARLWRRVRPSRLLVNTVTIPWWILVARAARVPVVCHVHEAEDDQPRPVRLALTAPLLLATRVVANSRASRDVLVRTVKVLARRTTVVYNGVPGPESVTAARTRTPDGPLRLVLVGRLSPRKGTDVALEALAEVRRGGIDARLRVCGSVFAGYEWFEQELRVRASDSDLAGSVEFLGYVDEPARELEQADVVLVPSRVEPFGNVAVEALLAERPLVASRVQGLAEIVTDGETGLLVTPGDVHDLAEAIRRLAADPALAAELASTGRKDAEERFGAERYRDEIAAEVLG
ncbi:glycosyltransferase family 4 protein [Nocardioides luteus]|uniref:glycosyltransferase family 4 protein n=1 Tax=Nocardioides luteus TaxID=1844 RepID=UPI0018C946DC|nr:glycosyltransferase family 4 protein [Nocardioides luteus]MBG6098172.1 glycosyltransferase involved in cell wall biosynthesis [Nocardioides luteus]